MLRVLRYRSPRDEGENHNSLTGSLSAVWSFSFLVSNDVCLEADPQARATRTRNLDIRGPAPGEKRV